MEKVTVRIDTIRLFNNDNGFIIFMGKDFDTGKSVSVKGTSFELNEDDIVDCEGKWVTNPIYGPQFVAENIYMYTPTEGDKILSYLKSGYIRGIREKTAINIYEVFGDKSIEVLDKDPMALKKVKGIGAKTLEKIIEDWNEKRILHKQNESLKDLGFTMEEALKISKILGGEAINIICKMPYALVTEPEFDFSFDKIDKIALNKLRYEKNNAARILTYLIYTTKKSEGRGNTYIEKSLLMTETRKKLGVTVEEIDLTYQGGIKFKKLIENNKEDIAIVQRKITYDTELYIAEKLKKIIDTRGVNLSRPEKRVKEASTKDFVLSKGQNEAILSSLVEKVNIINGGPGVGKTTALKTLITILKQQRLSFTLCAPTGKAAQRMAESSDEEANTIHKTLEYNPQHNEFQRDEANPIDTDFIIIDETSMVDIFLFVKMLKAVPNKTRLILIGDVNQIPSISAGCVLKDLISSKKIPTSFITEIQRQSEDSEIVKNAYLVNEGDFFDVSNKKDSDFFFIRTKDEASTLSKIKEMIEKNIPKAFNIDPKKSLQLLTPTHEKTLGRKSLNKELQNILNKEEAQLLKRGDIEFRLNDNVIQTKNNYEKEVFNGDSGEILSIGKNMMNVSYNGNFVDYERADFDQLELSYAITMHKSQGSEYPLVIIPISHSYSGLLDRSLLYTAITRGKEIVIVIGSEKRVKEAIKNDFSRRRKTYLKDLMEKTFN